ncbi:hypothetical protein LCGC14_2953290 [marine sediment metagenome]|uniref:DUF551 domain-containing protein n=1 Tax=marine sediment metagenome TaxID=412755 RepID=A0A0F8Y1T7_9ZZZZ
MEDPSDNAISCAERMPKRFERVLAWAQNKNVAPDHTPIVAWNSETPDDPVWWTGLGGSYIKLRRHGWAVTHWLPLSQAVAQ